MIGTARSFDADVTVPGGNRVPMAAVTGVGVRANRTRRGVLTELMRTQLRELHTRGVPVAMLYASEGRIYGRFGYGIATRTRDYRVDRRRAVLRPEVPTGGEIDLLGVDGIFERLPRIYDALPHTRPGMMTRPPYWWAAFERHARKAENPIVAAVHNGPDGPDGFVVYTTERSRHGDPGVLDVISMHAANAETFAGLWRYLLGVDLVDVIRLEGRPADEPTALLFTDARMCAPIAGEDDDAWLRLVDVPAALAAREYEGESVVIEVVDPVLEANSGRYLVSSGQVVRTGEPAGFRLGVDALAMLYFGAWRASALADTGWIQPIDPSSVARADRLFSTRVAAWCGTHF
ncbi:MAG TPA: GNAT family N-acetyltransferase [Amycolatopsis sp.]|uniref:GNAT family N-acetyltransferase n=1 Tax=Amycolatopsis sp. TaxID=37632 RepID=UPI002B4857D1|nr:GNAT family N-acetyltransferase [Amycolatopsis sp.]HKS49199.1 GNAT family N-acetyltransferase [Amycolatopsis sp.]